MRRNTGSLADLQRAFQDYVLRDGEAFADAVRDGGRADRATRLGVYREGYALRLVEVLTNDYPGLLALAGADEFDRMARAYITAHPSRHPSVRGFGHALADFLARTPPYVGQPALAEMARFEWALGEAFDAPDCPPVRAEQVMALPPEAWETLTFAVVPSLRRVLLQLPVPQAWQRRGEVEPGTLAVGPSEPPVTWIAWRPALDVSFRSLEADEAVLLDALMARRPFPELCAAILPLASEAQAAARSAALLRAWIDAGLIGAIAA